MKSIKVLGLLLGSACLAPLGVTSASALDHHMKSEQAKSGKTIVDVASNNKNFSTLVTAVKEANLVSTLSGDGPFTVFAPTDTAFEDLPSGTLDLLLKPENEQALKTVLTYHVVEGKVKASDLTKMIKDNGGEATVSTVEGTELTARIKGGNVVLEDEAGNEIRVVNTDIDASNGVIHVIDGVLLPASGEAA